MVTQIQSKCTPNKGEALAAQLAISPAYSLRLSHFILESDSQVVILALQKPTIVQDWCITDIIHNILDNIPPDSIWSARKVHRSANFYAHYVAHWAAARFISSSIPSSSLLHSPPGSLVSDFISVRNVVPVSNVLLDLASSSCNSLPVF
jgi:hypothetical protein